MEREQLDNWCEKGILGLVLAILVYTPLAFGGVPQIGFDYFVVVEGLTVVALVLWLLRFCLNPKHRLLWPPVCWAVLAFVTYAVGRYFTADVEFLARQELIKVIVYALLFYLAVHNLHRQEFTQIVGLTLVFVAMLISLYAVYQFLTTSDYVWQVLKPEGYRKRGSGTFICPNHLAGYLAMILPLALTYTLTGRFNPLTKIFLAYATLVIFSGISATISRGGWLAMGVSLAALFFWLIRQSDYWKRALVILGTLLVVFAAFFWKADVGPERRERFDLAWKVEDVRFQVWGTAARMWKEHALFGVGPAHFDVRFPQFRPAEAALQPRPERVHNDYLNTLVDWGIVGALLVLACWAALYYQVFTGWKYVQRSKNDLAAKRSNKAAFVAGGSAGLLAILVHSLFDYNLHIPSNAIVAVMLMALVASHYRFASEEHWHTVRWPLRIPVMILLLAALGWLAPQIWRSAAKSKWLLKGERAQDNSDAQLEAFKNAAAAQPGNFDIAVRIGDILRDKSLQGAPGHNELAHEAIAWFQKAIELNRYSTSGFIGRGMCLDWLGEHKEAANDFEKARALDPNGYFTQAYLGWHYFQVEDYSAAQQWLERSLGLMPDAKLNPVPHSYLKLIADKLNRPAGLN